MDKWYLRINIASGEILPPTSINELDVWETFEMDQYPYTVYWFDTWKEAKQAYEAYVNS